MKRGMEVIRSILLNVESDKYAYGQCVSLEGVSDDTCAYHVALMQDAGLVEAKIITTSACPYAGAIIIRLTSAGHDFCDGIRQDTIWNKARDQFMKYGLSVCVEFVKIEVRKLASVVLPSS